MWVSNLLSVRNIIYEVEQEISRQFDKWGDQRRGVIEWMLIEGEELGEAMKEANEIYFRHKDTAEYRKELIQVAAVAINALYSLDRGYK